MKKEDIQLLTIEPQLVAWFWGYKGLSVFTLDMDSVIEILSPIISPLHPLEYTEDNGFYSMHNFDKFLEGFVDFDIKEIFGCLI